MMMTMTVVVAAVVVDVDMIVIWSGAIAPDGALGVGGGGEIACLRTSSAKIYQRHPFATAAAIGSAILLAALLPLPLPLPQPLLTLHCQYVATATTTTVREEIFESIIAVLCFPQFSQFK